MTSKRKILQQHPPLIFDGKPLHEVENHKHLGITFNKKLSWSPHIDSIAKGASHCIDAMRKLKYTMDRKTLDTIYLTFVRPKLEYANIVWNDCTKQDADLLENLQLSAARIVTGARKGTSHIKIYNECNWPLLSERRKQNQLVQLYKMVNHDSPQYLTNLLPPLVGDVGNYNLRNNHRYKNIATRTVKYQKSFLPNVINLWNNLDADVVNCDDLCTFKSRIIKPDKCNVLYMHGSRTISIVHAQLRMECSILNAHLHSLHVLDDPGCACGFRCEDNKHFLINCPLYNHCRYELYVFCADSNIGFTVYNLLYGSKEKDIAINKKLFEMVQNFIQNSGRFN